jgi:signal transduction histidine kinase
MVSKKHQTISGYCCYNMYAMADRSRLFQVFANLLNNAIKFTKEGSIIIIVQRKNDVNEEIVVSVKDTGVGIDTDIPHRLFQGLLLNHRQLEQALVYIFQKVLSKLMVAKYGP